MKKEQMYLVSVKPKNSQEQGVIYVVDLASLSGFIDEYLTEDVVLLIDTVDAFAANLGV